MIPLLAFFIFYLLFANNGIFMQNRIMFLNLHTLLWGIYEKF